MPIYEYQCQSCGKRSEAMQRMSEPPLETCEDCGGGLKKLVSAPTFQFKGSGWYVTDYAKGGDAKDKGKDAGSGESKDKDSKKSDTDSSGGSSDKSSDSSSDKSSKTTETVGKTKSERIASG